MNGRGVVVVTDVQFTIAGEQISVHLWMQPSTQLEKEGSRWKVWCGEVLLLHVWEKQGLLRLYCLYS